MENNKQINVWILAFIHFLIGGFILQFIIYALLNTLILSPLKFVMFFIISNAPAIILSTIFLSVAVLIRLVSVLIGVYFSSIFIKKKYRIIDANSLVNWSTAMYILFVVVGILFGVYNGDSGYFGMLAEPILGIIIYYLFSKKFITNNI